MTTILTTADIEHFHAHGHVVIRDCFSREFAEEWVELAYRRLGYDRRDPSTWERPLTNMPVMHTFEFKNGAPKAWQAACELLGGEDRIWQPATFSDAMIMNLGLGKDKPWTPPGPLATGWHKDGDFFRHFLDSPEQGLLTIVLWTDVISQGGGTFVACDSVPVVARFLAQHPEGVLPQEFCFGEMIDECCEFAELTGKAGDIVLIHPYVLHASSQNVLNIERAITNPPFHLLEPMNFNRADKADFSPVETSILRGLGVDRLDFQPTAPRERVHPERERIQAAALVEERKRLAIG
jgi:hypothetical protein